MSVPPLSVYTLAIFLMSLFHNIQATIESWCERNTKTAHSTLLRKRAQRSHYGFNIAINFASRATAPQRQFIASPTPPNPPHALSRVRHTGTTPYDVCVWDLFALPCVLVLLAQRGEHGASRFVIKTSHYSIMITVGT